MVHDDDRAAAFEAQRGRLQAIAYRMLGSLSDADDAVQETWLRLSRTGADEVANLPAWLTTVVSRICLDMLRARASRREEPIGEQPGERLPDPVVTSFGEDTDPQQQAELADTVGMALLVVLDTLSPTERLAFVLHDMFAVPFGQIAVIAGQTPNTAAQHASRARRRVQSSAPAPDTSMERQREAVAAWIAAARGGNFDALLTLLDPDVVTRIDLGALAGGGLREVRGATGTVKLAASFADLAQSARAALVGGCAGIVVGASGGAGAGDDGQYTSVMGFSFAAGAITEVFILADPARLARLRLAAPGGGGPHQSG